jgi:hypothetical protein
VLPFQVIEHVDEPRAEKETRLQMDLFDTDPCGRQLKGWTNKLSWGGESTRRPSMSDQERIIG